jgi:hypothetical protein
MSAKDRECCDEIISVKSKQEGILKDVSNLESLYEPVQKAKTVFIVMSIIMTILLGTMAFLWRDLYALRKDLYEYNQSIMQEFYNINLKLSEYKLKNTEMELNFLKFRSEKHEKDKRLNR